MHINKTSVLSILLIWLLVSLSVAVSNINIEVIPPITPSSESGVAPTPAPPETSSGLNIMLILQIFVFVLIGGAVVGILFYRKEITSEALGGFFSVVIYMGIFGLIIFLANRFNIFSGVSGSSGSSGGTSSYGSLPTTVFSLIFAAILGIVFAYSLARAFKIERRKTETEEYRTVKEFVEEAIYQVKIGKDARGAILAAYKEMEKLMRTRGVKAEKYFTPREFRDFALEKLNLDEKPVNTLTALFEKARYSTHEMDESERQQALSALEAIRDGLEK